jgi:hypothetical protein
LLAWEFDGREVASDVFTVLSGRLAVELELLVGDGLVDGLLAGVGTFDCPSH